MNLPGVPVMKLTRRHLVAGAAAVAVAPIVPAQAFPGAPPAPLFPAWQVGVEDGMNWRVIFAETAERALQLFREEIGLCEGCDGLRCAELDTEGDCEHSGLEARQASAKIIPPSEHEGETAISNEEMRRLGWSHHCDRHHDVCDDWQIVTRGKKSEIVCDDCMEIEDWEIVDPEYARELRLEEAADGTRCAARWR